MHCDLRVMILTHHDGGLLANGSVAEGSALIVHANYADVFSHHRAVFENMASVTNIAACGSCEKIENTTHDTV